MTRPTHKKRWKTNFRLRLRKNGWLGRTWGYAPHHPTQVMLEEAELEIDRIGIPATRILHMWQGLEQLGVLSRFTGAWFS